MRSRLLFDPESGSAPILKHLNVSALLGGGGQPKPGARRDDHIFLPADKHRTAVRAGGDDVSGLEGDAAHGRRASADMLHLHRTGRFGHPPKRDLSEGRMAPDDQKDDEGAQKHWEVTFGKRPHAARARLPSAGSLRLTDQAYLKDH